MRKKNFLSNFFQLFSSCPINYFFRIWYSRRPVKLSPFNEIIFGQVSDNEIDEDVREVFLKTLPDEQFDEKTLVNWSQKIRENLELKNNEIFKLMRKVLTSRMFGPEMSELILILGREKIIERLKSK